MVALFGSTATSTILHDVNNPDVRHKVLHWAASGGHSEADKLNAAEWALCGNRIRLSDRRFCFEALSCFLCDIAVASPRDIDASNRIAQFVRNL